MSYLDIQSFKIGELSGKTNEREMCKRDVCMYCDGRALGYHRTPEGPNEAGNYIHRPITDSRAIDAGLVYLPVLCNASSIFARERFEFNRQIPPPGGIK